MPLASHQATTPVAAASPNALPPASRTAATPWTWEAGERMSVSRVPGPPPRTLTDVTLPGGGMITVQPVIPTGSVQCPMARSSSPRATSAARRLAFHDLAGEPDQLGVELLVLFHEGHVPGAGQDQQPGVRDRGGHVGGGREREQPVG